MTILLLGSGPRLSWSQAILAAIRQRSGSQSGSAVRLVDGVPTRELLQSLLAETPLDLIVIDPPRLSCSEQDGTAFLDLLRLEGSRAVFTFELSRRARRVVRLANGTIDGESWIARLVACAGMPATIRPAELLRLFPPPPENDPEGTTGGQSPPWIAAVERDFLDPLRATTPPTSSSSLTLAWPRELFLDGDTPGQPLPAIVEVAGRPRILAYGPYLPLPRGEWQATAFLGFSPDIGKMPFILEVDTAGIVSRGFFEADRGGIFTLSLDFQVVDLLHPIELQVISQDSALEGQFALMEVRLEQALRE